MGGNPNHTQTNQSGKGPSFVHRFLLRLVAIALLAAACSIATPLPAAVASGPRDVVRSSVSQHDRATPTVISRAANAQRQKPAPTNQAVVITRPTPTPTRPAKTDAPPAPNPSPAVQSEVDAIDATIAKALQAPDFVAVTSSAELRATAGRNAVVMAQLQTDALEFVAGTSLPAQSEFAGLFDRNLRHLFTVAPTYQEPIIVTQSKLLVDRTLAYELAPNVCKSDKNRRALGDLCFDVDPSAPIPSEVASHLIEVRTALATVPASQRVVADITAGQAMKMNDVDLLELSLNTGPRSIRRLSTVPRGTDGRLVTLDPTDPVVAGTFSTLQSSGVLEATEGVFVDPTLSDAAPFEFDTEYFLTGHTVYRSYGDTWSYEKDAWWHPRIYVAFSYSLQAGFGVRAPFSIDVDYVSGDADETTVAVSVDPVSLDVAAEQVGLDPDAYFDGKEFVLELDFDCGITASVAGIGGTLECDDVFSIDTNFSRDFNPVIGGETRNIENWWLWEDGKSPITQSLAGGAIWAEANLGIGADVVDGRVGVQIDAGSNTDIDGVVDGGMTWFEDRSGQFVTVDRDNVLGGSSFSVSNPHYGFAVAVRPKVKFTAGIDLTIYEKDWSFVVPLDFLGFQVDFDLDHHDGTVESHDYELYEGVLQNAELGEEQVVLAP